MVRITPQLGEDHHGTRRRDRVDRPQDPSDIAIRQMAQDAAGDEQRRSSQRDLGKLDIGEAVPPGNSTSVLLLDFLGQRDPALEGSIGDDLLEPRRKPSWCHPMPHPISTAILSCGCTDHCVQIELSGVRSILLVTGLRDLDGAIESVRTAILGSSCARYEALLPCHLALTSAHRPLKSAIQRRCGRKRSGTSGLTQPVMICLIMRCTPNVPRTALVTSASNIRDPESQHASVFGPADAVISKSAGHIRPPGNGPR